MATNVLIVEDDVAVAQSLRDVLEAEGYAVWQAGSAAEADAIQRERHPNLILLDIMLPDVDGLVYCSDLRRRSNTPVILLSATQRRTDRVIGLRLGADEFISKPFDVYELLARIEALLRRAGPAPADSAPSAEGYRVGDLVINSARHEAVLRGHPLPLTPSQFRILACLASRPNEVLSRDDLVRAVRGKGEIGESRAIDVHIRRLRQKLAQVPGSGTTIITVRGYGYKLGREPAADSPAKTPG
jgi:DNA-binding response OmpR family regulator